MVMPDSTHRYLYKHQKPQALNFLWPVLAVVGILSFLQSPILAILLLAASVFIFSYHTGIELNTEKNTYRLISAVGPLSFGKWLPVPPLQCVSVFTLTIASTFFSWSNRSITTGKELTQVYMISENRERILIFEHSDDNQAMEFGKTISKELDRPVWDATSKPGKWLK